eukprot:CAMPEP_0114535506 /NCGR_PEP_ID=MMETSP0109-20121206/28464_1 /TAXON_ID=29199 /ORGANISM="Chlorarachnion reptans, Strain CCCM449" /LENGTH=684 /DNA_ID=CAMNT_0001719099 /DNA_START=201 /DNA_END=2255 /DNA_ORIENTATION=-
MSSMSLRPLATTSPVLSGGSKDEKAPLLVESPDGEGKAAVVDGVSAGFNPTTSGPPGNAKRSSMKKYIRVFKELVNCLSPPNKCAVRREPSLRIGFCNLNGTEFLHQMFDLLITMDELNEGFRSQFNDWSFDGTEKPAELLSQLDMCKNGSLSPSEFETIQKCLKLALLCDRAKMAQIVDNIDLLTETHEQAFVCIDYNATDLQACLVADGEDKDIEQSAVLKRMDLLEFLMSSRADSNTIRWVNIPHFTPITILKIASKYGIHPLVIEDIFEASEHQPKFDIYHTQISNSWEPMVSYFIVLPLMRLTESSAKKHEQWESRQDFKIEGNGVLGSLPRMYFGGEGAPRRREQKFPDEFEWEHSSVCIIFAGKPYKDTLISVEASWEPMEIRKTRRAASHLAEKLIDLSKSMRHAIRNSIHHKRSNANGNDKKANNVGDDIKQNDFTSKAERFFNPRGLQGFMIPEKSRKNNKLRGIFQQLASPCSRLRKGDSFHLCFTVMKWAFEMHRELCFMHRSRLMWIQGHLKNNTLSKSEISVVFEEKRSLQRSVAMLKPSQLQIKKIKAELNRINGHDSIVYLDDIEDTVEQSIDDYREFIALCDGIVQENRSRKEDKMNNVLFVLTIVTTVFVPAQFLTGMYGMNFVRDDGSPGMPELTWRYGYLYFWCMTGVLTSLSMVLMIWMLRAE